MIEDWKGIGIDDTDDARWWTDKAICALWNMN
jgi:hypothetical protein